MVKIAGKLQKCVEEEHEENRLEKGRSMGFRYGIWMSSSPFGPCTEKRKKTK
jgi:hypothetical protein